MSESMRMNSFRGKCAYFFTVKVFDLNLNRKRKAAGKKKMKAAKEADICMPASFTALEDLSK